MKSLANVLGTPKCKYCLIQESRHNCRYGGFLYAGKIGGEKGILENVVVIGVSDESNPN